jgi:hypothetical protein
MHILARGHFLKTEILKQSNTASILAQWQKKQHNRTKQKVKK